MKKTDCIVLGILTAAAVQAAHVLEEDRPVLTAEEGMLLGNGDLSVSVYQTADAVVFRFGKGDVWDRRIDYSHNARPANIKEVIHGVLAEGWKSNPYDDKGTVAIKGTDNPQRMKEICCGTPPSTMNFPYPMPKPVGELALKLPVDLPGMQLKQRLVIEEGRYFLDCSWANGVTLALEAFITPVDNLLGLHWEVKNWNPETCMARKGTPPVWFMLYRWADPDPVVFASKQAAVYRHGANVSRWTKFPCPPLPPPSCRQVDGLWAIEQKFYPELTFKDGFRYLLAPFAPKNADVVKSDMHACKDAYLHVLPKGGATSGELFVGVASSSAAGGPEAGLRRLRQTVGGDTAQAFAACREMTLAAAKAFWGRSGVSVAEPLFENLWYETLHARRCVLRKGTVPPGLFLPSTVDDFSHWHGDYHSNYNIQSIYWGLLEDNQPEAAQAYFDMMAYFLHIGRKIARDYYNARGAFIQLACYPLLAPDDYDGVVPMGRMAYMTGWATGFYWEYYRSTLDKKWLAETGYPVLRDAALFYLDFLKKGGSPDLPPDVKDGLYHLFPSNQGEDGFTGNPHNLLDRPQVQGNCRAALYRAIAASEALDCDKELRAQWRDRYDRLAGNQTGKLKGLEKICYETASVEFGNGAPYRPQPEWKSPAKKTIPGWYFGQFPWSLLKELRTGHFIAGRDFDEYRKMLTAWRRPNGLRCAMAVAHYGRAGAWSESLGAAAPMQEMMLQSWDGALRLFPAWPQTIDASFRQFRAVGAFLVSTAQKGGKIGPVEIFSEKGADCTLYAVSPGGFAVKDATGKPVECRKDEFGRTVFSTVPNALYRVTVL